LFVNLLRLMKGGVVTYDALTEAFAAQHACRQPAQVARVLDALLVLVAWALRDGKQPLVTCGCNCGCASCGAWSASWRIDPKDVRLRSERDLPGERDGVYLPMVQCSQCRTTGWLSRLVQGSNKLSTQLDEIYNTWFSRPARGGAAVRRAERGAPACGGRAPACLRGCGNVQHGRRSGPLAWPARHQELLPVFRVTAQRSGGAGQCAVHPPRRHLPEPAASATSCCCWARAMPRWARKWWSQLGQRVQRRQEADRVFGLGAGRRAPGRLLRRPHLAEQRAHGAWAHVLDELNVTRCHGRSSWRWLRSA
jgi:hypothetical protein